MPASATTRANTSIVTRAVARRTGRRVAGHGGGGVGHGDAWRGGRDVWRVRRGHSAFRGSACVTSLRRMRFLHNRRKRPGGVTVRDALTQTRFCVGSALSERIAHHRVDIDRQTQMCYSLGVSVRGVAWDNSRRQDLRGQHRAEHCTPAVGSALGCSAPPTRRDRAAPVPSLL